MSRRLAIRSRRVIAPEGEREAAIVIEEGAIAAMVDPRGVPAGTTVHDFDSLVLMPGCVDSHVHVNEPGRTHWEGFETATRAAACGGVTTIVDMPLNSAPVTTDLAALRAKQDAARGRVFVDCAFWGGVVPGNARNLEPMLDAGVCGFKAFLIHSGIDDFPAARAADLREAMPILAGRGVPLLAHAELETDDGGAPLSDSPQAYATYLASRPAAWEHRAIELLIALSRDTGCRVHVVHLSSAAAAPALAAARAAGVAIQAETCPHYLTFAAEEIPDGRTEFKCAPPVRDRTNREALWQTLRDGIVDVVVSDHSPCVPSLKESESGDFLRAWGGIASLQLALSAVWTEARLRGFTLRDVVRWMSEGPARLAGLHAKGRLAPGCDADIVAVDPDATFTVDPGMIRHRHGLTPYTGRSLRGSVVATYLRGERIWSRGEVEGPQGRLLERTRDGFHRSA